MLSVFFPFSMMLAIALSYIAFIMFKYTLILLNFFKGFYMHLLRCSCVFFFIHLFICAYIVWVISPPCPTCDTNVLQPELIHLYLTSQSPSQGGLFRFMITILAPLQWGHKMLSSFGFLTYPHPPICVLPLACDPSPTKLLHLP
jgi:hypothetical protein